jgi:hypothetical protein
MTKRHVVTDNQRDKLLNYSEAIAIVYYKKHKVVFEKDSVALKDLKQEADIICLKMIREYGHMDGINGFILKKFTSRAVGWRMRDMLRGAIVQSKNNLHLEDIYFPNEAFNNGTNLPEALNSIEFNHWTKETFFSDLSKRLQYGFTISDVLKEFDGKDLFILQHMLDGESTKEIQKQLGYKNNNSIREAWQKRIIPKVKTILKKVLAEYKD